MPRGIRKVGCPGLFRERFGWVQMAARFPWVHSLVGLQIVSQIDVENFHRFGVFRESFVTHHPQRASVWEPPEMSTFTVSLYGLGGALATGASGIHSALEVPKANASQQRASSSCLVSQLCGSPCHAPGPAGVHCPPWRCAAGAHHACMPLDPAVSTACSEDTHLWAEGGPRGFAEKRWTG